MRNCLLFVSFCLLFVACKKSGQPSSGGDTPPPVYPSYKVGDFFQNDTLQGIVFFTTAGGSTGLMVSLEETLLSWCVENHINEETGATNPYDGWNNTNILMDNYDLFYYPVIRWSYLKNTWNLVYYDHRHITRKQWYVPSSNEMRYLLLNQEAVNATLEAKGYPTLEGKTYWSSTETGTRGAAAVRLQNGEIVISDTLKTQMFFVRAVRCF